MVKLGLCVVFSRLLNSNYFGKQKGQTIKWTINLSLEYKQSFCLNNSFQLKMWLFLDFAFDHNLPFSNIHNCIVYGY